MTDHRISHTSNMRTVCNIGKAIIAALITSYAMYNIADSAFVRLIREFRICKLRPSHNNHIYFVLRYDLFCQRRRIDPSYSDSQHPCLFSDSRRIVNIKSIWHINRRNFIHRRRRNDISSGYI